LTEGPPISTLVAFHRRAAVDRLAVGVEKTPQLVAHLESGRFAGKNHFGIGGDALRAGEDLQRHHVAGDLHYLRQSAVNVRQLLVADARWPFSDTVAFGQLMQPRIDPLECSGLSFHIFYLFLLLFSYFLVDVGCAGYRHAYHRNTLYQASVRSVFQP
jgi:hypothetical protein